MVPNSDFVVSTCSWFEQLRQLAKLNFQAHQSAMARSDEFILESLVTFDKLGVVVHELLAVEAWKEVSALKDSAEEVLYSCFG